ncbi:MAG: hypothetical protein SGI92_22625 [Bryobacteraceae bacterium]|nr:hypothetical protein [Bryobacteraceae bacterium]
MQTQHLVADTVPEWHRCFLELLPTIKAIAARAYRSCEWELRQELTAQVVAECVVAVRRLHEVGRIDEAFATPLARYAIRRVGCGLQPGLKQNQFDLGSRRCTYLHGVTIERLHWRERDDNDWNELVVEDRHHGSPAETACLRIDIESWLRTLSIRERAIAWLLALGERTSDVAQQFNLSKGRVAQLRKQLAQSWRDFHSPDSADPEFAWVAAWEGA